MADIDPPPLSWNIKRCCWLIGQLKLALWQAKYEQLKGLHAQLAETGASFPALFNAAVFTIGKQIDIAVAERTKQSSDVIVPPLDELLHFLAVLPTLKSSVQTESAAEGETEDEEELPGEDKLTTYGDMKQAEADDLLFSRPCQLTKDPATGILYIADAYNHLLKQITPDGKISIFAGVARGSSSHKDGPRLEATFFYPFAIIWDAPRQCFYVSDHYNNCIRLIKDGIVSTLVTGIRCPYGLALAEDGALYICESENYTVQVYQNNRLTLVAGTSGVSGCLVGPALEAKFYRPAGICIDPKDGSLYITDQYNHCIRQIKNGVVTNFAGTPGKSGRADGPRLSAGFYNPSGIAIDSSGAIFVGDKENHRVRVIRDGLVTTVVGKERGDADGHGLLQGQIHCPCGVYVDEDEQAIYIADFDNSKIKRFRTQEVASSKAPILAGTIDLTPSLTLIPPAHNELRFRHCVMHSLLVLRRCPTMPQIAQMDFITGENSTALPTSPISDQAIDIFAKYFYSDTTFGLTRRSSVTLLTEVAFLGSIAGFPILAKACLVETNYKVQRATKNLAELWQTLARLQAKVHCLPLFDFAVVLTALNSSLLNPKQLSTSLGIPLELAVEVDRLVTKRRVAGLEGQLDEVIAAFEKESSSRSPSGREISLKEALLELYHTGDGADWTLVGTIPSFPGEVVQPIKCHSVIAYSRWPYFQFMQDANLQESRTRCLTLPADLRQGGLTSTAIKAFLEVMYTGASEHPLALIDALSLHENAELYQIHAPSAPWFIPLVEEAYIKANLGPNNSFEYFRLAQELNLDWLATMAAEHIMFGSTHPTPLPAPEEEGLRKTL